jgi:hypothetical protein
MKSGTRPRQSRPLWRRILRFFAWLILILSLPIIAFVVWNCIDEAPTKLALHYASPTPIRVADADNAWLAMAGLGAAPESEPAALGRRRVDAFHVRFEKHPMPPADESEDALFKDSVPAVNPDAAVDGAGSLCPARDLDCLNWAGNHAVMLERLREANALRLQRFEDLMKLPGWQALYPDTIDGPLIDLSIVRLHLNLIALELVSSESKSDEAQDRKSLGRLASEVEFWQRVRSEPQDLITVAASGNYLEDAYWIASAWIDHASTEELATHAATIQRILVGSQAPIDWEVSVRNQFQRTDRALSDAFPGFIGVTRQCLSGTTASGCFSTLAITAAYAPQATRNLLAIYADLMQKVLEAPPPKLKQVSADAGKIINETFPQFDDIGRLLGQMCYNFTGRIMANISIPAYDYGRREYDREALRRLVQIKLAARLEGIDPAAMSDFLSGLDEGLDNPLNGQAFDWDPVLQTLYFSPSADKHWKRTRVDVGYRLPRTLGYKDCADPVVFQISEVDGYLPAAADLRFASCGSGLFPLWLNPQKGDDAENEFWPRGFGRIDVRRHGDHLSSEILLEYDAETLVYRAAIDASGGNFDTILKPIGRDSVPQLRLRSVQQAAPAMVVVNVESMPARKLAHAIASIKGLDLIGEQLLSNDPATFQFEQGAAELLNLIADISDLELHETPPRRFEFVRPTKTPAH